jgi:hypothetical protein
VRRPDDLAILWWADRLGQPVWRAVGSITLLFVRVPGSICAANYKLISRSLAALRQNREWDIGWEQRARPIRVWHGSMLGNFIARG